MIRTLSREQAGRIDLLAVQRYGISGLVLMENAGRNAAALINKSYGPAGQAFLFCGPGNNGGDGCVIARHLHNAGWSLVVVITAGTDRWTPDMTANFRIIEAMGLNPLVAADAQSLENAARSIRPTDVVVDAILGTGFQGNVRAPLDNLFHAINAAPKRGLVAVDVPSGLDCDTGMPSNATLRADYTITFAAMKRGFIAQHALPFVGRIEVAGIGAPRELIEELATSAPQPACGP
jgi:NAD(P)H-hydrate epimerase